MARKNIEIASDSSFLKAIEEEAREHISELKRHRIYRGTDPDYRARAKIALGVIGAYVRHRATLANETSNTLILRRLEMADGSAPKRLAGGGD